MEVGHEYPRRQFNVAVVVVAVVGVKPRAKMISMQFAPHKSRNVSQGEGKAGKRRSFGWQRLQEMQERMLVAGRGFGFQEASQKGRQVMRFCRRRAFLLLL